MHESSRKAVLAALLANLGIAGSKLVAWAFTGAASMLAEAVHSLADCGNQGLLLLGDARAQRAPDAEHPFGYGRERYFWSFMVAVVLFALGAVFAIYEGIHKLSAPEPLASPAWAIGVLVLAIGLEAHSFRVAIRAASAQKGDAGWWAFIRHAKTPEIPVVLLEDLGALVGLVVALAAVSLALVTGQVWFDAAGSIAIGVLLGGISWLLGIEMRSLLIGEAASPEHQARIRGLLESHPSLRRLIHLRTQHLGPDELLVGAKVELDGQLSFAEVAKVVNEVEDQLRSQVPVARVIYIEPDVFRATGRGEPHA